MSTSPGSRARAHRGRRLRYARAIAGPIAASLALAPQTAVAQKVRITGLSDVTFGLVTNTQADARRSQNICLYSNSAGGAYSVSAAGSGSGSSFVLSNGLDALPYAVEWADSSGKTSGTELNPSVALTGQQSSATHQFCNSGPATTASMTVVLKAADLSQAREGSYSGTLTLLIAAE